MSNTLFLLSDVWSKEKVSLDKNDSEEAILGGILLNRIAGIAYDKLNMSGLNKESRRTLAVQKQYYDRQYDIFIQKLRFSVSVLTGADFSYAFLKGAFLSPALYKKGQRISNDIDLLIEAQDASKAHTLFVENGFIQGHCDDRGNIVPATRREIIEAKMNYGETVPYLRYYGGELLEIDLNFSTDFKAKGGGNVVRELLDRRKCSCIGDGIHLVTLAEPDFLIHLCCHLYKEATTYDWLIHRRDLMLYKFADINIFLHTYGNESFFRQLCERITGLCVEKECYYTFVHSAVIYPHLNRIPGFQAMLENIRPASTEYLTEIYAPATKTRYVYNLSFEEWFACPNRIANLQVLGQ